MILGFLQPMLILLGFLRLTVGYNHHPKQQCDYSHSSHAVEYWISVMPGASQNKQGYNRQRQRGHLHHKTTVERQITVMAAGKGKLSGMPNQGTSMQLKMLRIALCSHVLALLKRKPYIAAPRQKPVVPDKTDRVPTSNTKSQAISALLK
jgi:hypothetical protein